MRRPSRWASLLCALVLLATACGGGSDGDDEAGGGAAEPNASTDDAAAPAGTQELVIGAAGDPWLDAEVDTKRFPTYPLNADVCQTLVRLTPEFEVAEGLASEWEFVGDNTFSFTLNENVTFSDGAQLTAEDVEYTLDYTVDEPQTSSFGFLGSESTTVIDPTTVEVTPTEPNLRLLEQITHPTYAILAPGSDPLNDPNVTCTGPFRVTEYEPEEFLVVERNEEYWGEAPMLDRITFRFIPDDTTRTLALQNGDVDLILDVPRSVLSSLENIPGITIETAPVGQVTLINLARRDATGSDRILADSLVRRALAHAIDEEAYVNGVLDGNAEVVSTVAPPSILGEYADLVEGVPYDPDEAADLLDQAGWVPGPNDIREKDGRPLQLSILVSGGGGGTSLDAGVAEFVQAQLREVGIEGNVEQLDPGAYTERTEAGTYDLNIVAPNQNDANPAFLMSLSYYTESAFPTAQIIAPGEDSNFEALIDETQQAVERDDLQRLAAEAMHELVDVEVAAIPLAGTYRIFGMQDNVHGLEPHPSGTNQRWSTVFLGE